MGHWSDPAANRMSMGSLQEGATHNSTLPTCGIQRHNTSDSEPALYQIKQLDPATQHSLGRGSSMPFHLQCFNWLILLCVLCWCRSWPSLVYSISLNNVSDHNFVVGETNTQENKLQRATFRVFNLTEREK